MANAFRTNIPLPVCAIGITAVCRVATLATRGRDGQGNAIFAVIFQPLPLAGLPLSRFTRRGRKGYSTAYEGRQGNLLLLCVAEQYRGAVEPSETEGLEKINMGNYNIYNDVP